MTATEGHPHILHLTSERGWRGGERQLLLLTRGLAEHGVDQAVAAPAGSQVARRVAAEGIATVQVPSPIHLHPLGLGRLLVHSHRRVPSILHSHTSKTLDAARILRVVLRGASLVHTHRVAFPLRPGRKHRTAADRYVAVADAVARQLLQNGAPPERVMVIPSGVDLAALDAVHPADDPILRGPGPVAVSAGALAPEKGHAVLLAAWERVEREVPGARLVILGDGPERSRLEAMAARKPGGHVHLAGFRDDVASWLKAADVFVLPSLAEGIAGAALEAMACGLPVVATWVGGVPEVVEHGVTGLLVPPDQPGPLTAALARLLTGAAAARAMGRAGRRRVEARFGAAGMVDAYLRLYAELLGS